MTILEPGGWRIITSKKVLYYWELRFACIALLTYLWVLMLPVGRNCYWQLSVELIVILSAELYFTLSWLFLWHNNGELCPASIEDTLGFHALSVSVSIAWHSKTHGAEYPITLSFNSGLGLAGEIRAYSTLRIKTQWQLFEYFKLHAVLSAALYVWQNVSNGNRCVEPSRYTRWQIKDLTGGGGRGIVPTSP